MIHRLGFLAHLIVRDDDWDIQLYYSKEMLMEQI
jgi:hypothetical protein